MNNAVGTIVQTYHYLNLVGKSDTNLAHIVQTPPMMVTLVGNWLEAGAVVGRLLVELMVITVIFLRLSKLVMEEVVVVVMVMMVVERVSKGLPKISPTHQRAVVTAG